MKPQGYEVLSVSQCRDLINLYLSETMPVVMVEGEVSEYSVSKNKYVYFTLKDESASLKCFMMKFALKQPIENGMTVRIAARPRITVTGNFSMTVEAYQLVGEGSLARAFEILKTKLEAEGLFRGDRKRSIAVAPSRIGLIASADSAAYGDFMKILNARWSGITVVHRDVLVQGKDAEADIVLAINDMNQLEELPEVIVITRGGGSSEDLVAFSSEAVTRAVSGSRVPTIVAVGHERDVSLAELAADKRASTPSNAAEILVPDRHSVLVHMHKLEQELKQSVLREVELLLDHNQDLAEDLHSVVAGTLQNASEYVSAREELIAALNPLGPLDKGYAIIRSDGGSQVKRASVARQGQDLYVQFSDGHVTARVSDIIMDSNSYD